MTVLEIEVPGGDLQRLVVRRARRPDQERSSLSIVDEHRLISRLREFSVPVPRPRLVDPSRRILPDPYAVYDYVDGALRLTSADPEQTGEAFADHLAMIHRIGADALGDLHLPRRADVVARLLDSSPAKVHVALDEVRMRDALHAHRSRWESGPRHLLHGDLWPGNVLWDGDEVVAVIDWEVASLGDPLADVGTTRLDLLWAFGPRAMAAFTDRYLARTTRDPTDLPAWDLVAALRPAGALSTWAADWVALGRPDVTADTMRTAHRWFTDQALDRLDGR